MDFQGQDILDPQRTQLSAVTRELLAELYLKDIQLGEARARLAQAAQQIVELQSRLASAQDQLRQALELPEQSVGRELRFVPGANEGHHGDHHHSE